MTSERERDAGFNSDVTAQPDGDLSSEKIEQDGDPSAGGVAVIRWRHDIPRRRHRLPVAYDEHEQAALLAAAHLRHTDLENHCWKQ